MTNTDTGFSVATVKSWLQSQTIHGLAVAALGSIIMIFTKHPADTALLNQGYDLVTNGLDVIGPVLTFGGQIWALIGRFRAATKIA